MDEDHCRALGAFSRPGLDIVINSCEFTSAGARVLAKVLGRNQGPTKLNWCEIDTFVLADGLRGNSRLWSSKLHFSGDREIGNQEVLAIAGALRENKGLVELNLAFHGFNVNNETWEAICDSLKAHPTLEVLELRTRGISSMAPLPPALIKSRIQALVDMLKVNMSIHTINLRDLYSKHGLFRGSVVPYLETNRFRPHLLAIQQTRPITFRAKVLGRALLSARTDANNFWMLLSGNVEVAFPSGASIAAAANLPTPATAAATSTTDVAAFAGHVTTAATAVLPTTATIPSSAATPSTASDAFPVGHNIAAAANVATRSPGRKRKARSKPYEPPGID
jgi:hypothetical protein